MCRLLTASLTCEYCASAPTYIPLNPRQVTLRDLYKGKTSKMALTKDVICKACDGRGGKEVSLQCIAAVGADPTVCNGDNVCM